MDPNEQKSLIFCEFYGTSTLLKRSLLFQGRFVDLPKNEQPVNSVITGKPASRCGRERAGPIITCRQRKLWVDESDPFRAEAEVP
jgi:hypothetical protein